jgi:SAM-dependent methyltransferase
MFVEEAKWIRAVLARQGHGPGVRVLDIGSSTLQFRQEVQPHIDAEIFAPLREGGAVVTHLDAKPQDGVDVVCDLTDPATDAVAVVGATFDVVLCCNLLEHVTDREATARAASALLAANGRLLVTVPQRYPEHHDPIDTLYRPKPHELAGLFERVDPGLRAVATETLRIDDPAYYRPPSHAGRKTRLRSALRRHLPPLRWRQSCVVFQRG